MNRFWKTVFLTTLLAGTLDIIAAHLHISVIKGEFPFKLFYGIAAGAIGLERASSGGLPVFVLGVLLHYFISLSFTLFFFLIYSKVIRASRNKYVNGLLFGLFVWPVMNLIILYLSALPGPFVFNVHQVIGFFILVILFCMPISVMADKYYKSLITAVGHDVQTNSQN